MRNTEFKPWVTSNAPPPVWIGLIRRHFRLVLFRIFRLNSLLRTVLTISSSPHTTRKACSLLRTYISALSLSLPIINRQSVSFNHSVILSFAHCLESPVKENIRYNCKLRPNGCKVLFTGFRRSPWKSSGLKVLELNFLFSRTWKPLYSDLKSSKITQKSLYWK